MPEKSLLRPGRVRRLQGNFAAIERDDPPVCFNKALLECPRPSHSAPLSSRPELAGREGRS